MTGASNYTDYYGYDLTHHDPDKLTWINRGSNSEPQSGASSIHSRYAYDAEGKLVSLERRYEDSALVTRTFQYGMLDQMIGETSAAGNVTSYYDVYGNRTSEYDSLRDTSAPQTAHWGPEGIYRQDAHASGSGVYNVYTERLAQRECQDANCSTYYDRYYHLDATGSVRYLTDASGTVTSARNYDAFGEATVESGSANPTPFGWEGGYGYQGSYVPGSGHGLGLYDAGLRQYDAQAGRLTTPDLIGLAGGLNRYAYVDDDPVNFADPTGLWGGVDDLVAMGGGLVIGIVGQVDSDLANGTWSSPSDYMVAGAAGALGGEVALYAGPAIGGMVASAATDIGQKAFTDNFKVVDFTVDTFAGGLLGSISARIPGVPPREFSAEELMTLGRDWQGLLQQERIRAEYYRKIDANRILEGLKGAASGAIGSKIGDILNRFFKNDSQNCKNKP